ncbi:2-hydroxyacyl-CoA lyase [Chloropicon primus]|uniref:2-hydroxyacyl-CoA lyase n=3 Tax=Chloropicon primus TaxID=1764295 RepID=A0A5B8MRZ2_9CHLO|nr:2-hydroxyacyl-CoA lyase [Chloropicon primus]UPR01397.1 2-hydroxyacyl-CoA lyase [Chloropicon primus]|eukprot:QDZ22180.1 2-hydroxyacyl-CoA lyase [Chloropicon primus]
MSRTLAEAILLSEGETREVSRAVCFQAGLPKAGNVPGGKDPEEERLKPITFGHLNKALLNLAHLLRSPSNAQPVLTPGAVAAIVMPNSVAFAGAFIGTTIARSVAAPLNPKYTKDEYLFYLEDQKAAAVLLPATGAPEAAVEAARDLGIRVFQIAAVNDPEWGGVLFTVWDVASGVLLRATGSSDAALSDLPRPQEVALLLHTSGTTSKPKGVPLTHANICASISNIRRTYEFGPKDVSLLVMPLFHVHGLMCGLLTALASRSQVVIPSGGAFSANMFWKDARHFRITWYTAVPTIHQVLLLRAGKDYPADDPPPLRLIRSSSSSLAPAILTKLETTFRAPVVEAYAMTEACHQMTSNPLPKYGKRIPGSVGKGMGVQVTILGDKLNELPPRSVGEVCIRGPNVTPGYLNNPKATAEAFAGGWFHTGDQGWLDENGYLTLTGRLKELINRGGEKISPLEIDSTLLSHPSLAEAVAFGMPDEKYGEVVHAAVVVKDGSSVSEAQLLAHCKPKLATFKIPIKFHYLEVMPKTPTGKIQRRMVRSFVQDQVKAGRGGAGGGAEAEQEEQADVQGFESVAKCLSAIGVKHMLGIVGIPVTQLATSAQAQGIRFIGFRNEQSAGYAASCLGFLTGKPAVLLTVSGPGVVHGLAGLSNATENCWPMIMISGSVERKRVGKGGFQEIDQCKAARPHCKAVFQIKKISQTGRVLSAAVHEALSGRPGGVYVDIPADILFSTVGPIDDARVLRDVKHVTQDIFRFAADNAKVEKAAALLLRAKRPMIIVGKGAAYSRSETELEDFVKLTGIPCLPSPMGKGLIPDAHDLCVGAARSKAMKECDVVLVLGTRLNWQWSFGEAPKWSKSAKFIVVDTLDAKKRSKHCLRTTNLYLPGDAKTVVSQLSNALYKSGYSAAKVSKWVQALQKEKEAKKEDLRTKLASKATDLMGFYQVFGVIDGVLKDLAAGHGVQPVFVNEGANTMDIGRQAIEVNVPRTRLDSGTMGTMGVGLGYAVAAALNDPERPVLAVLGDSAFGFSAMECEVIARYDLKVVVVVLNNGGIYGGDRREEGTKTKAKKGMEAAGFGKDPAPTDFVPGSQYEMIMKSFHGQGHSIYHPDALAQNLRSALLQGKPALFNVLVDPRSGVESARMNHMNKIASKL